MIFQKGFEEKLILFFSMKRSRSISRIESTVLELQEYVDVQKASLTVGEYKHICDGFQKIIRYCEEDAIKRLYRVVYQTQYITSFAYTNYDEENVARSYILNESFESICEINYDNNYKDAKYMLSRGKLCHTWLSRSLPMIHQNDAGELCIITSITPLLGVCR